jgi:hypothetical protein
MKRAILEIVSGPLTGQIIEGRAGGLTRIGRTAKADCALSQDTFLSGIHFGVGSDEAGFYVRDLASSNGTFLNGSKVAQATLGDGDRIHAGQSIFLVHLEGPSAQGGTPLAPLTTAIVPPEAGGKPISPETRRLLEILRTQAEPLFAILDAARDQKVVELLSCSGEEFRSLYDGKSAGELALLAPYLVRLPPESPLLEKLGHNAWGKSWGVYLTCSRPLMELRHHLRQFLMAQIEGGDVVYFRFYDPRVLRVYLPTCTEQERREFFGPVGNYLVEGDPHSTLLNFAAGRKEPAPQQLASPGGARA